MVDRKPLSTRQTRWFWVGVLILAAICVRIAERLGKPFDGHISPVHWAVVLLGAYSAWGGYYLRRKLMAQATSLSSGGKELLASRKWSAAQLVALMSAQGVVLWGVVAKMALGCPRWFSAPFYVTGIVLLIIWKPGKNPIPMAGG